MKRIIKGHEPASFIQFKQENEKGGVKLRYDESLGSAQRTPIKEALLKEQGYICAYTLKRIALESSHIEHLKPEELCRKQMEEEIVTVSDLDYGNMVACFPKKGLKGIPNEKYFGAIKKDAWWENEGADFISPLREDCEIHFKYNKDGSVEEVTLKGKKTIEVLSLNHDILKHERANAINEFIYKNDKPLNTLQTLHAIENICKKNKGSFVEFCIPIKHSLDNHLEYLEKVKQKRKIISKAKKKQ
ncbi:hypothetical protein PBAL39_19120 [Pedobacter sp. BAL39]|uniref:retron system putative HNH endonuclease n=1 Tax=Pedobacter sp. BAL39 TaxID=391596 RepID=UPI000155AB3D|nr:retron system putative HNH endonuclease [Pedobacter sp. BAL39]EDM34433.1 hypothetical protein PBAL39_19120 [Pedobacter sp. BAL39]